MEQHVLTLLQHIDSGTLHTLTHQITDWWRNLEPGAANGGTLLILLGIVWIFARIIRKAVGLLFMICVIYLTLRYACGTDLLDLLPTRHP